MAITLQPPCKKGRNDSEGVRRAGRDGEILKKKGLISAHDQSARPRDRHEEYTGHAAQRAALSTLGPNATTSRANNYQLSATRMAEYEEKIVNGTSHPFQLDQSGERRAAPRSSKQTLPGRMDLQTCRNEVRKYATIPKPLPNVRLSSGVRKTT